MTHSGPGTRVANYWHILRHAGALDIVQKTIRKLRLPTWLAWRLGHNNQVLFWEEYLRTRGARWPSEFIERTDPNTPLQAYAVELLPPGSPGRPLKILDVGAGPLTCLGKKIGGDPVEIVATDPLARAYDELLSRHGITPLVRTIQAHAEELERQFSRDSFDLVHARNSLDHSYAPYAALCQMVDLVKPGCYVLLRHEVNEAEHADYSGHHQWNFTIEGGDFVMWNKKERINVSAGLSRMAEVGSRIESGWIINRIRKRANR